MSRGGNTEPGDHDKRHVPDMVWYILIGLMVLVGVWMVVVYVPENKIPPRKWTEFSFYSLMLFAFVCKFYWRYRRRAKLWRWLVAVFVIHLCVYIPILVQVDVMPAILYVLIMPMEAMLIFIVFKLAVKVMPDPKAQL
jgi:peptidoglycan/LPS O-acetylase OafA/YrhL